MKTILSVLTLVAMIFSFDSYADASGPYITIGGGTISFSGVKISPAERSLLATPGVTGSSEVKTKSTFEEIGLGYRFNQYFSVEGSYLGGVKMHTTTRVTNVNVGSIKVGGNIVDLGDYATNVVINRDATASAINLKVNGEYPITGWASFMGTIGACRWHANMVDKISVDNSGVYIAYNESDHGTSPMASVGFNFKLTDKSNVSLQWLHINKVTMPSLTLRHSL